MAKSRKKHFGHHCLFQGGGHGSYGVMSVVGVPSIPFTDNAETDSAIILVSLIITGIFIAKNQKWV